MRNFILFICLIVVVSACKKENSPCNTVCETTAATEDLVHVNDNCECECYNRPLIYLDNRPICVPWGLNSENGFIASPSPSSFACRPEEPLMLNIEPNVDDARTGEIFVSHYGGQESIIWVTYIKDDVTSDTYNFTWDAAGFLNESCDLTPHYNGKVEKLANGNMLLSATYFLTENDLDNQINPYKSIEIEFLKLEY